jgi:hypothetical protein
MSAFYDIGQKLNMTRSPIECVSVLNASMYIPWYESRASMGRFSVLRQNADGQIADPQNVDFQIVAIYV